MAAPSLSLTLKFSLLLLPLMTMMHGCAAVSGLEIRQSPVSQLVKLGESATFHCSATGVGSGSSFDLVLYNPLFHPDPIYITSDTPTLPDWLHRTIRDDYEANDQGGYSDTYTATVTIEGSYFTNGTTLRCRVFRFSMSGSVYSDTAELMVIGPPSTPSHLSVPMNSVYVKSNKFSAVWNVPFTHTNHSVSHYTVRVSNPSQNQSYERSFYAGLERESSVQVSLQFPPHTSSCDILNISLTAVNDIGASLPASANIFIPKVPDVDLIATTTVHPESSSSISIVIEIKFPEFCWFERVNYSVVLEEVSEEGSQVVQIERSVESPQETITETLSAGVVPNANYSVVVFAKTHTWNSSTAPHNFNPPNIPTTTATEGISTASPAVEGVSSGSENGSSLLLLGVVAGTVGFLLLLIAAVITVICVLRSRARNSDHPMCIEDMKVSSVPHEQITNPIYDGHLYEAVRDLSPQESLTVKPELHPLPPTTAESMYSESPTLSKRRQIGGVEEMEDAYVQMHTCTRK